MFSSKNEEGLKAPKVLNTPTDEYARRFIFEACEDRGTHVHAVDFPE